MFTTARWSLKYHGLNKPWLKNVNCLLNWALWFTSPLTRTVWDHPDHHHLPPSSDLISYISLYYHPGVGQTHVALCAEKLKALLQIPLGVVIDLWKQDEKNIKRWEKKWYFNKISLLLVWPLTQLNSITKRSKWMQQDQRYHLFYSMDFSSFSKPGAYITHHATWLDSHACIDLVLSCLQQLM